MISLRDLCSDALIFLIGRASLFVVGLPTGQDGGGDRPRIASTNTRTHCRVGAPSLAVMVTGGGAETGERS